MSRKKLYPVILDVVTPAITDKAVVFDLDLTLLCTKEGADLSKLDVMGNPKYLKLRNRIYHFEIHYPGYEETKFMWGVTRPHITEFLLFCMTYFKCICVWSAGDRPYVEAIVKHLFKDLKKPLVVYTADETPEVGGQGKPLKDLSKMMRDPASLGLLRPENTLTIDDNEYAFRNNPYNAIFIPPYNPDLTVESMSKNDPTLLQIKHWLCSSEVLHSSDIRKVPKDRIFSKSVEQYIAENQRDPNALVDII